MPLRRTTRLPAAGRRPAAREDTHRRSDPATRSWSRVRSRTCNGPRSFPVIEPDSAPGFVALVSPFSIISKRSSPSRVRSAAPFGAPLTAPGRFGPSSSMGKTARFGPAANVTLAGEKIVVRYNRPNREHGGCEADFPFLILLQPLPRLYAHVTGGLGVVEKLKGRYHTLKEKK